VPAQNPSLNTKSVRKSRTAAGYPRASSMAPMEAETIRALLERAFPSAAELAVEDRTGTGDHFQVTVVSSDFDGVSLIDQHRRVNDVLASPLADGSIHELRIRTKGTS
jgi:stress-induced morphogen